MLHDLVPIVLMMTVGGTIIGLPIARAYARRIDRPSPPALPPDAAARLERMEQAIDAIAVEVERISEGQRFTTRLLSDRNGRPAQDDAPALPAAKRTGGD